MVRPPGRSSQGEHRRSLNERRLALHKVEAYPETCEVYVRLKGKTVLTIRYLSRSAP